MPAAAPIPNQQKAKRLTLLICLALAALVGIVFGQAVYFDFVNYDDPGYIYKNPVITQGLNANGVMWLFTHVNVGTWFPLTDLSHQFCWQLFGANAGGHHLTNVLLHMTTVIVLFLALRRMTGAIWTSAFATALFAIHPLRVESVAWVVERKDVLSGLFFVLTLWTWTRHVQRPVTQAGRWWSRDYLLALFFFVLGLMSKSMLVTLPFVLLLLDYWPLNRGAANALNARQTFSIWLRLVAEKIPFFIMSVAIGVITIATQKNAVVIAQSTGIFSRIGNTLLAYTDYLGHIFYPVALTVSYPQPEGQPAVWKIALAALLLSTITGVVLFYRRKHPYLIVGWLWYLGMLLPVIDIMQASQNARADRYTYLPQIGVVIMLAWRLKNFSKQKHDQRIATFTAIVLTIILSAMSYTQSTYWKNSLTLWNHSLACNSKNSQAENNLGSALNNLGRHEEAIPHFERAIQIQPDYFDAHVNLGVAYVNQNKRPLAIQHFGQALQINPHSADAHYNLGDALSVEDKLAEATQHFEQALQTRPNFSEAHYDLGLVFGQQGKWAEAIPHFESALRFKIDETDAKYIVAVALGAHAKWPKAIELYQDVLQHKPDFAEAHNNLGIALGKIGQPTEAGQHFQTALTLATNQGNTALAESIRVRLK